MDILFVSERYHPFVGGMETQTRMLVHELAKRHRVDVLATRFSNQIPSAASYLRELWLGRESLLLPPCFHHLDKQVRVTALKRPFLEWLFLKLIHKGESSHPGGYHRRRLRYCGYQVYRRLYVPRLRQLIRGKDLVHSVAAEYLGWAAEEAARAENVPFLVSTYVHPGQGGDDPENVAFYNRADIVFALLESDRVKLTDLGVPPELVRLTGVVPLLPPTADPLGFRERNGLDQHPVVLFVGRLQEYKGAKALLDSARHVWTELPDVHFLFVGPARVEELAWFERLADTRVRYLGLVSEQEKADAMAACDLFCMPSRFEVLPAVYLEAWANEKAVLGGTAYGLPELIEGNHAGLTVDQDPALIARRIVDLLRDEERRREMGKRGRELVARRFSKRALVRALEDAYEDVLQTHALTKRDQPFVLCSRDVTKT